MLKILKPDEINSEDLRTYRLCYVDTIPATYDDYTKETVEMMKTPEYKEYAAAREQYCKELQEYNGGWYTYSQVEVWEQEHDPFRKFYPEWTKYDEPDYVEGYTHYLYFTDNMEEQWGDDWNDAPYEHNAETPYDDDTNIIRIPVKLELCRFLNGDDYDKMCKKFPNYRNCDIKFPCDYGYGGNSYFSVDMINNQAVAWIFVYEQHHKIENSIAIHGGDTIETVLSKLERIDTLLLKEPQK
jgi:hypothetical protein